MIYIDPPALLKEPHGEPMAEGLPKSQRLPEFRSEDKAWVGSFLITIRPLLSLLFPLT